MSVEGGPDIVTDGLVLHLDAANNRSFVSGSTTWFDLSGNRITGSLVNGPTYSSANGGIIVFDGTNDYVYCGTELNNSSLTISLWVSFNSTANQMLLTKGNWDNNSASYSIIYYNNEIRADTFLSNATYGTARYSFSPTLNVWYNIVFVANSGAALYSEYINGNSITFTSSTTYREPRTGSFPVYIGINSSANYPLNGQIAQTSIYNKALSAKEIRQNYHATKGRYGLF